MPMNTTVRPSRDIASVRYPGANGLTIENRMTVAESLAVRCVARQATVRDTIAVTTATPAIPHAGGIRHDGGRDRPWSSAGATALAVTLPASASTNSAPVCQRSAG